MSSVRSWISAGNEGAEEPLSPTELAAILKRELRKVGTLRLKGEVDKAHFSTKGDLYFDIKDAESKIRATLFADDARRQTVVPEAGHQYVFEGSMQWWRTGEARFAVSSVEYDSLGRLREQIEKLRRQLEADGAMRPERKRPLPFLPHAVALVTSQAGAVLEDLKRAIWERFPEMPLYLYPAAVQGKLCAFEVSRALEQVNRDGLADVVIVARGGGDIEGWAGFSSEMVVRAILNSRIPVITALGHSEDQTLADEVADRCCRTPSVAGKDVVPDRAELGQQLERLLIGLRRRGRQHLEQAVGVLGSVDHRYGLSSPDVLLRRELDQLRKLRGPERARAALHQRLDRELQDMTGLGAAMLHSLVITHGEQVSNAESLRLRLKSRDPELVLEGEDRRVGELESALRRRAREQVGRFSENLDALRGKERMRTSGVGRAEAEAKHIEHLTRTMASLSPLKVLERGYAIAFDEQGKAVLDSSEQRPGATVRVRLARGGLKTRVEEVEIP